MRKYITITVSDATIATLARISRRAGVGRGRIVDAAVLLVGPCPERREDHTGCPSCVGAAVVPLT